MKLEELYLSIINNLRDGVYYVDEKREILFWNHAAEQITGYSAEEIVGKTCQESNLNHIDEEGRPLCIVGCPLFATIMDGEQRKERVFVRHKSGGRISVLVNIFPICEDGKNIGAIEIFSQDSPVAYEDKLIEHLSGSAMHDTLTGLPNRRYIESFIRYKLDEYHRFDRIFAVLFADIDNFSHFNNQYGHDIGDAVLTNISSSIQKNIRKNDIVGRWGGEEFVGVYSIANKGDASIVAEKFRHFISQTQIPYKDGTLSVSVSVGITVVQPYDTIESIVRRGDQLMYQSKREGKNQVSYD